MKVIAIILLLIGMLVFQSKHFSGELKLIAAILGACCFVGLIVWSAFEKKKEAADPALMLNDIDID